MQHKPILSLDCWGTLIAADSSFWQEYSSVVKHFTNTRMSKNEINLISKKINLELDLLAVNTERSYSQKHRLSVLLGELKFSGSYDDMKSVVQKISRAIDEIIINHIEYFTTLEDSLAGTIQAHRFNYESIVLSSNTGFISGNQTTEVLSRKGFNFFDMYFYSDVIGYSKPSEKFTAVLIERTRRNSSESIILHIGNDPVADNLGNDNPWMRSIITGVSNQSVTDIILGSIG
jgi:FMN phosphatase YigB (HAD superfamily)